jgi:hypothetical protein
VRLRDLSIGKRERATMRRREHVEPIRYDKCCRVGTGASHGLHASAGVGIDGVDQSRLANGNMDDAASRIEERDIWRSG